jgi:ABC-2 type transport system ATP-binding protein
LDYEIFNISKIDIFLWDISYGVFFLTDYAIIVKNLVKIFDNEVTAVDNLNLNVKKGEIYGFLGPNGAGKTTSINIFSGLLQPTSGEVFVGGIDVIKNPRKIKAMIGVCPQEPSLFGYLTGRQNIEFFGNLHCIPKEKIKKQTEFLLNKLNFNSEGDRRVKKYSGGMVRRINVAVALINDPEIVFLDEPTVGMDPQSRRAVWNFITDLKKNGKTVILTTHYIEEAEQLCERVGIIDHGKIIELGNPDELKQKYQAKTLEEIFIKITGRKIREEI